MENRSDPLKPPVWTWEIPIYFFVGGAAGAAAVIASVGAATGAEPAVIADARWIAAVGAAVSPVLLISDLGRPARFLNMLRVLKWQSPMSVGAWTLAVFSTAIFAAIGLRLLWPDGTVLALVADVIAGLTGSILATYTGVLIGATAIPVWSRHIATLPLHFGASALGVAVSLLELLGHRAPTLNRLGLGAAAIETILMVQLEWSREAVNRPLLTGVSGALIRTGAWLTGPVSLTLRLIPGLRLAAAVSMTTGSLVTRFGWLEAGRRSAKMPAAQDS